MIVISRVLVVAIAAGSMLGSQVSAQSKNPIEAAKDAFRKARGEEQQAKKAQQPPAAPPQTPQASQPSNPRNTSAASPEAASGDCCSPDALRKIASSAGFLDIVGIKLGMTPEQALTAVKAFNGQMKIDIINARVENPEGPFGSFTRVPQYAVAHTVGLRPNPNFPALFAAADGSSDVIVIEFTIPPSPPLVGRIVREVNFPRDRLVVASNLLDALRKKYGQESIQGLFSTWVFDSAGKPVSRPVQPNCLPSGPHFGWQGGMPNPEDMDRDSPTQLSVAQLGSVGLDDGETSSACRPFAIAVGYPLGQGTPPTQQMGAMTVLVQSPALLYGSGKAAHDWLKAKADAKARQQEEAAKARSAPKL